jgi:tetratricopeptide (TPR) repeat protein
MGQFSRAKQEIRTAIELSIEHKSLLNICVSDCYKAWSYLLEGKPDNAHNAVTEAREFFESIDKESQSNEILETEIEWLLSESLLKISLEKNDTLILNETESHLNNAYTRCRRFSLVFYEPGIMLTMARLYLARDNTFQAMKYAEDALYLADRCQYKLYQAEIHNFLAHMALERKDYTDVKEHANIAYKKAFCDGPKHCYKKALDEAEALLRGLDMKPPKLKRFYIK